MKNVDPKGSFIHMQDVRPPFLKNTRKRDSPSKPFRKNLQIDSFIKKNLKPKKFFTENVLLKVVGIGQFGIIIQTLPKYLISLGFGRDDRRTHDAIKILRVVNPAHNYSNLCPSPEDVDISAMNSAGGKFFSKFKSLSHFYASCTLLHRIKDSSLEFVRGEVRNTFAVRGDSDYVQIYDFWMEEELQYTAGYYIFCFLKFRLCGPSLKEALPQMLKSGQDEKNSKNEFSHETPVDTMDESERKYASLSILKKIQKLHEIHAIQHNDVRMENVLIQHNINTHDNTYILCDFGISRGKDDRKIEILGSVGDFNSAKILAIKLLKKKDNEQIDLDEEESSLLSDIGEAKNFEDIERIRNDERYMRYNYPRSIRSCLKRMESRVEKKLKKKMLEQEKKINFLQGKIKEYQSLISQRKKI